MQVSELTGAQKIGDVLQDEVQWLDQGKDVNIATPQRVAWISNLTRPQVGEPLTGWSADDNIGGGDSCPEPVGDVTGEHVYSRLVGAEGRRGALVVFDSGYRSKTRAPGKTLAQAASASEQVHDEPSLLRVEGAFDPAESLLHCLVLPYAYYGPPQAAEVVVGVGIAREVLC
jgi:hypothetical protein